MWPATGDIALNVGGGGHPQAARVTVDHDWHEHLSPSDHSAGRLVSRPDERRHSLLRRPRLGADPAGVRGARGASPICRCAAAIGALGVLVALAAGRQDVGRVGCRTSVPDVIGFAVAVRDRLRTVGDVGVVRRASLGRGQPVGRRLQIPMDRSRLGSADVAVGDRQPTRDVRAWWCCSTSRSRSNVEDVVRSRRHRASTRWRRCWRRSSRRRSSRSSCSAGSCCAASCPGSDRCAAIALQGLLFGFAHADPVAGRGQPRAGVWCCRESASRWGRRPTSCVGSVRP